MYPYRTQVFFNQYIPVTLYPNNNNQFQEKKTLSRNISLPTYAFITTPLQNNFQVQLENSYLNQNQNNNVILPYNTNNQISSQFPLLYQNNIPLKPQNKDFTNAKINQNVLPNKNIFMGHLQIENYYWSSSNLIGRGAFGKIYLGKDSKNNKNVAIKMEEKNNNYCYLENEYKIYNILSGIKGIPKVYWCGSYKCYNIIIMELLGSSLQDLFISFDKKFSLPTILKIGIHILNIIQYIHEKGFIHRDIKPDSFLISKENNSNINIIDFGFAKEYINLKTREHIPFKYGNKFIGNLKFASIYSHFGIEQSRRDDLESLGYMLLYFLKGSLPWEGTKNTTFEERFFHIKKIKTDISLDNLCKGVPIFIKDFIKYSRNLKFDENPNYPYLRNLYIIVLKIII